MVSSILEDQAKRHRSIRKLFQQHPLQISIGLLQSSILPQDQNKHDNLAKALTRLPAPFPTKRTGETIHMKAIVVTDQAAGTAGMKLVERPEPPAAINDVIVQVHASGFVPTELAGPSTWTDRRDRDRTPSILGHELAGMVTALGYGTTGLSVGHSECSASPTGIATAPWR